MRINKLPLPHYLYSGANTFFCSHKILFNTKDHGAIKLVLGINKLPLPHNFFFGTPSGLLLFDHLLWLPIFQSSIYTLHFKQFLQVLTCSWWPSVGSFCVLHLHLSFWLVSTTSFLVRINNSHPCWNLNLGPPRYQVDMLPTELSWLGSSHTIFFLAPNTFLSSYKGIYLRVCLIVLESIQTQ